MDKDKLLKLKKLYEEDKLSENDLTDEQVTELTKCYIKELDELKIKSDNLDIKLDENKKKILELIEKAKNLKK